MHLKYQEENHK